MLPNVRFFAGFTSSVAFRYSVIFMIRLRILTTMPTVLGMSFFLYCSFRGFGCGKAMSYDDLFRRDQCMKTLPRTADGMAFLAKVSPREGYPITTRMQT